MERIQDGRRNILIHPRAEKADLPLSGDVDIPPVASTEPFLPVNMNEPNIYPGDVIVGYDDGRIVCAELVYDKIDDGVLVYEFDTGLYRLIADQQFSARMFRFDETHIYDDVTQETPSPDVTFDESKLVTPEPRGVR